MHTVCYVEDELDLSNLIKMYLENAGYNVICFSKGEDAINYIGNKVDIWVLDIMLSDDISGYDIIRKIREKDNNVPVIFTSARDQDLDKILGLELGSDDYVTKPYSPKELVLRINNIIKRAYPEEINNNYSYKEYVIDKEKRTVSVRKEEIKLTTLEFDLILLFIENRNKSFSREDILNQVWGNDYFGSDRVVDDLVRRIRKKLPDLDLNTIYGFGYRLT